MVVTTILIYHHKQSITGIWPKHTHIWSNFMKTHIDLKICHVLHLAVSITEGQKIENHDVSWGLSFMTEVLF